MKNKVVLLTGASSGTGLCLAKEYIEKGAIVYGCARNVEKMKEIETAGGHILKLDITDSASIHEVVKTIIQKEGRIDVLVNNAGYGIYGAVETTPMEEVRRQFAVNYFGLVELTQCVLPYMREARNGVIVNISSMGGKFTVPFGSFYHGTKFAVEAFSDSLRMETTQYNIKTVIIEPGLIQTNWGIIAADNIRKYADGNAYEKNLKKYADYLDKNYRFGKKLTDPRKLAKSIAKITAKKHPRTRYQLGKCAKLYIALRCLFCDKAFDRISIMSMGLDL